MKKSILLSLILVAGLSFGGFNINQIFGQNPRTNPDTTRQKNMPHKSDTSKMKKSTKSIGHDTLQKKKRDSTYRKPKKM